MVDHKTKPTKILLIYERDEQDDKDTMPNIMERTHESRAGNNGDSLACYGKKKKKMMLGPHMFRWRLLAS